MDDRDLRASRARIRLAPLVVALAIAFLLGAIASGVVVRRSARIAAWLHPLPVPQPIRIAVPVAAPTTAIAPVTATPAIDEELTDRVATIEGRIDAIEARAAATNGNADRAEGLLVAFAARRALDRGQSLGFLEGMMRDRFGGGDAPAVAMVIAAAQRPVTLAQLQDGLQALSPTLVTAQANENWWTATRRELGNLFVVRHADAPSTLPADRIDRAQHALQQGQVDVAAAEVSRLPGSARAADWLGQARRYSLARQALDRLETAALLKPRTALPPAPSPPPVQSAD